MTEEVQNLAEVESVQAPEATAAEENASNAPANPDNHDNQQEERRFTQAELDAMIGKRLAKEQRKWEREQQARAAELQLKSKVPADLPPADQFESSQAYAEALAEKRAHELIEQRELAKRQAEMLESYHDKEEEARNKYDDFEQVAYNPKLRITDVMAETIRASEVGPDLAYHLGQNPKEAERISGLPPFLQAKEIGRIEAKLTAEPPSKKVSSAPAPIKPVTARNANVGVVDTTDPRSTQTMSTSEWIEAERRRQIAKLQSQRNR